MKNKEKIGIIGRSGGKGVQVEGAPALELITWLGGPPGDLFVYKYKFHK